MALCSSYYSLNLIIFFSHFKETFGMPTNGADFGSFLTNNKMPAVTAFPNGFFRLFKYLLHLNIFEECTVSFLVGILDFCNHSELCRKISKTFFLCILCKSLVHISPLIIFAFSSMK